MSKGIYIEITPFFPTPDSFRGPFIYDQVKAIIDTDRFDRVVVFRPCNVNNVVKDYVYEGIEVHYFPVKILPANFFVSLFDKWNIKSFLTKLNEVGIDIQSIKVAHSHVSRNGIYADALKEINNKIITILQHHDLDPYNIIISKKSDYKINLRFNSKKNIALFNKIDLHVGVSKNVIDNLRSFPSYGKNEIYKPYLKALSKVQCIESPQLKRTYVLYNGVNTDIFHEKHVYRDEVFTIGCIGNFLELKSQITLIKAVEEIIKRNKTERIKAVFIGTGPCYNDCVNYVHEHNLNDYILFKKEVKHEELVDFYNSIDLFVLPSIFEGFGCVFTEAFACGVPFMTCYGQSISELLPEKDWDKWLLRPTDYIDLANKILLYKENRYKQRLNQPYDIKFLIDKFLNELNL